MRVACPLQTRLRPLSLDHVPGLPCVHVVTDLLSAGNKAPTGTESASEGEPKNANRESSISEMSSPKLTRFFRHFTLWAPCRLCVDIPPQPAARPFARTLWGREVATLPVRLRSGCTCRKLLLSAPCRG